MVIRFPAPGSFFSPHQQVLEPQNLAVVATDRILRFGGSCSQDLEWPADNSRSAENEEEARGKTSGPRAKTGSTATVGSVGEFQGESKSKLVIHNLQKAPNNSHEVTSL